MRLPDRPWARAAFLLVLLGIVYLSLEPGAYPPRPRWDDKIQHAFAYAVAGILGFLAFPTRPVRVGVGLVVLGALLEVGQAIVPNRSSEFADLLANTLGVATAWGLVSLCRRIASPSSPPMA
jgi:VanZ family protein